MFQSRKKATEIQVHSIGRENIESHYRVADGLDPTVIGGPEVCKFHHAFWQVRSTERDETRLITNKRGRLPSKFCFRSKQHIMTERKHRRVGLVNNSS